MTSRSEPATSFEGVVQQQRGGDHERRRERGARPEPAVGEPLPDGLRPAVPGSLVHGGVVGPGR